MSNNNFYLVAVKNGRYVKTTTDNFWESCESIKEAAYYTKEEADNVIKHLADKCYVYGATAVYIGGTPEAKQATKEAKQECEKKSRRGTNIPKGSKWVVVNGKRKLVRPGEQASTAEDCEQLRTTAKDCGKPVVKKSLTTESAFTWQDIKFIVHRADFVLEKHTKKELLTMGEQDYYEGILNDFNAIKNILT